MAAYHEYFSPTALAVDLSGRGFFEEDDFKPLDDRMLDRPLDPVADDFSPKTAEFSDHDPLSSRTSSSTHAFFRPHPPHPLTFRPSHVDAWESSSCTPTPAPAYDGFRPDFDHGPTTTTAAAVGATTVSSYLPSAPPSAGGMATGAVAGPTPLDLHAAHDLRALPVFPTPTSADTASFPTSPLDGWSSSGLADPMDPRGPAKRARPGSPTAPHSPLLRRDGIRKKNARFEIPAERNLLNIDQLIAQSSDDQEIKELKQQKRLLRNRQAALDSRQRKKQHTERLEEEKKHYTNIISDLEEDIAQLKVRESEHVRREEEWKAAQQRYERYIEGMHLEKEEMIRRHTLETADLRKKNAFLSEHLQKADGVVVATAASMSTVPSSTGFSADFSDADGLGMEATAWDAYPPFLHDFSVEPDVKPEPTLALAPRRMDAPKVAVVEEEKPAASGLLLLLLLCGAFVASKSSTTSTPNLPRMPDNIRAASATVLDNIFKDAGVASQDPRLAPANRVEVLEPGSSRTAWPVAPTGSAGADMIGLTASSLDVLQHQLVRPSKEQEEEQLFSLSADQYNGVVSPDAYGEPEPASLTRGRSQLGDRLTMMRGDDDHAYTAHHLHHHHHKGSAAEVYTRSLLWDKVPAEVVREFAKFVADSAAHDERQKASAGNGG